MNIEELKNLLKSNNVPNDLYNLDGYGRKDERFCIETDGDLWFVYFSERGVKTTEVRFKTEDEACKYLLAQLID
jgi:hypothetical protein